MRWLQCLSVDNVGLKWYGQPVPSSSESNRTKKKGEERFDFQPNKSTSTLIEETVSSTNKTPNAVSHAHTPRAHKRMSVSFRQALLSSAEFKSDSCIGVEVAKLSDPKLDAVNVFARCLPHVVPNVILAKREVSMC